MKVSYRLTFDRIGRNHYVPPLDVQVDTADSPEAVADLLAERAYNYARTRLGSRDVRVTFDWTAMTGLIFCGIQVGGQFAAKRLEPDCDWCGEPIERQLYDDLDLCEDCVDELAALQ